LRLFALLAFLSFLPFPTAVTINSYHFGYGWNDAFWRTLVAPVEGTIWAPQFDESKFSKVRIGMSAPEVTKLIGDPLQKDCGEEDCFWLYTKLESGLPGYDQRWLIFDLKERVIEIRKSFELD